MENRILNVLLTEIFGSEREGHTILEERRWGDSQRNKVGQESCFSEAGACGAVDTGVGEAEAWERTDKW